MATLTKTARTLQASASNAAAATATGTALDVRTCWGLLVNARVTNGATGPTVACSFRLEVSNDNTNFRTLYEATAQTGNSVVTTWAIDVPWTTMYVRTVFTGNTAQAVTIEALAHELTSVT